MQKRALAVHDISCVGRCSLTVALPILSAAGINTAIIPTALLSTHTGEFTGYTHLDLSAQLLPITKHIASLKLPFDAFYSGYLASPQQAHQLMEMLTLVTDEKTHIMVDPAFADHGRLYSLMDSAMPGQMRKLCEKAHTIVPNRTEASFLLNKPYLPDGYDEAYITDLSQELAALGPENIVISDVSFTPEETGIAVYQKGMEKPSFFFTPRYEGRFHGTGDVFASFLLSGLLNDCSLTEAAQLALRLTHESIVHTLSDQQPLRYGVQFERVLSTLITALKI